MRWIKSIKVKALLMLMAVVLTGLACDNAIFINATAPLGDSSNSVQGTINVAFVNETEYRVITYWGSYNQSDLSENVQVQKLTLEAGGQSDSVITINCTRQITIAGENLRYAAESARIEDPDPADINDEIAYSDVEDSEDDDAEEPTAGTGPPVQYYIGLDYDCGDFVEIHFKYNSDTGVFSTEIYSTEN